MDIWDIFFSDPKISIVLFDYKTSILFTQSFLWYNQNDFQKFLQFFLVVTWPHNAFVTSLIERCFMNDRTVLFTANAGFILSVNGISLAVDAFPRTADRGFSALSEDHLQQLCQCPDLADIRYVVVTHDHNDHYSKSGNEAFLGCHPQARFIGAVAETHAPKARPAQNDLSLADSSILLHGDHPTYYFPGITFEFLRLPHEGAEFAHVANYGCLVTFAGTYSQNSHANLSHRKAPGPCRILFAGDASLADPAIAQWIGGRSIDLALLNFPWITLPKGRQFIQEYLPHTKIGGIHLPYEKEDRNHYVAAARKAVAQVNSHAITLFTEYGQELRF